MGTTETTQEGKRAKGYKLRPLELFEFSYCHDCKRKAVCSFEDKQMCVALTVLEERGKS